MNQRLLALIITLLTCFGTAISASPSVITSVVSHHLIAKETTTITFIFEDLDKPPVPTTITLPNAKLKYVSRRYSSQNGKLYYLFYYNFSSSQTGDITIPAITFHSATDSVTTTPLTFHIAPASKLKKQTLISDGKKINYYAIIHPQKSSLYPNETIKIEHKIYLPSTLNIVQWGLPLGDTKNCSAWRFEGPSRYSPFGWAIIANRSYQVATYTTTLTAAEPGDAIFGPLRTRIIHQISRTTPRGNITQTLEFHTSTPAIKLKVKNLPPNPPKNFSGNVGEFTMQVRSTETTRITSSESITITATIIGTGNLSTLQPPQLDLSQWKLISRTKKDMGEARKLNSGFAEFNYLIQPINTTPLATHTPTVSFCYLDPKQGKYHTLTSPGTPITIIPVTQTSNAHNSESNTQNSPANTTSDTEQKDILGIVPLSAPSSPRRWISSLPSWSIHVIPALLTFIIILTQLRLRHRQKQLRNSTINTKKAALKLLEQENEGFLKAAAAYVERWIDTDKHPDAKDIVTFRDKKCYTPETTPPLDAKSRAAILKKLKKLSLALALIFLLPPSHTHAAETHQATPTATAPNDPISLYTAHHYRQALTAFQALPDTTPEQTANKLYNIGNCYYRLHQPGLAAAHYSRALMLQPHHPEAQKNLQFIQNKYHSILAAPLTESQQWIATLSPTTYLNFIYLTLWLILLSILTFKYLKPQGWKLTVSIIITILAPLILATASYAYINHPERSHNNLQPAIIIHPTTLHPTPSTTDTPVCSAPIASPCHVITNAGTFSYIELADNNRGWCLTKDILSLSD